MSELPERLRDLGEAVRGCEWELPITASDDCMRGAQEIDRLRAQRLSDEDIDRIAVRMAQIVLDTPLMSGSVDDFEKWCRVSQVKGS